MRTKSLILTFLFLLFGTRPVFAVTVAISNTPATITDQPFNIDVSISGARANTTNYLRANFFSGGTTKYFGFTYNGSSFVNSADYSQYMSIMIGSSGNWNGSLQAKIDPDSNYYSGPGIYNLKVRRYAQSGSSYTWSNEVSLNVNLAVATPSSTPTPTPTPSPTPTPTPTKTPSPTAISKKTVTPTNTSSPTTKPSASAAPIKTSSYDALVYRSASVAGVTKYASESATPSGNIKAASQKQNNPVILAGIIFIIIGISAAAYLVFKSKHKYNL